MSFPNYKTIKHKFLFWKWNEKVKDNWKHVELCRNKANDTFLYCRWCNGDIAIAEEEGKRFKYCKRCLSKIK